MHGLKQENTVINGNKKNIAMFQTPHPELVRSEPQLSPPAGSRSNKTWTWRSQNGF